ncbi:MAG: hypothetical protein ACFFDP_12990, partial [Promethearchaeota archaeon]
IRVNDETSHFDYLSSHARTNLKLGYLVQGKITHPYSLALQDLCNLFVIGERAVDIYYTLLLQLCDDNKIPVIVLTNRDSDGYEDQVCETPFWHLDLEADQVNFDLFDLGGEVHPSRQVTILIELLTSFSPLSPTAKNLLHIIIWKMFFTTNKPTLKNLQKLLDNYRHHISQYQEICHLLSVIPKNYFEITYDNINLLHLQRLPTIITAPKNQFNQIDVNLLLLKLLSNARTSLPPLFLMDPPPINSQLFQWLCIRYVELGGLLVLFDSMDSISHIETHNFPNIILSAQRGPVSSSLRSEFNLDELRHLEIFDDQVAVRLHNESTTRFVTIF